MSPIDEKPSRNEDEYFVRENAEAIKALRARLDAERARQERDAAHMRCPRDGAQLTERRFQQLTIDVCPECGGTWLDKGELQMLTHVDEGGVRRYINSLFGVQKD